MLRRGGARTTGQRGGIISPHSEIEFKQKIGVTRQRIVQVVGGVRKSR